jgi:hypothetical protein
VLLTKEEEEQRPKSPGHTAHISTSRINFSGLLLDDDSDDDEADFFGDDYDETIPMQAAIGIKTKASESVGKDQGDKARAKAETKKQGTKVKKKKEDVKEAPEDTKKEEAVIKAKKKKISGKKDSNEGKSPQKADERPKGKDVKKSKKGDIVDKKSKRSDL